MVLSGHLHHAECIQASLACTLDRGSIAVTPEASSKIWRSWRMSDQASQGSVSGSGYDGAFADSILRNCEEEAASLQQVLGSAPQAPAWNLGARLGDIQPGSNATALPHPSDELTQLQLEDFLKRPSCGLGFRVLGGRVLIIEISSGMHFLRFNTAGGSLVHTKPSNISATPMSSTPQQVLPFSSHGLLVCNISLVCFVMKQLV